MRHRLLLVIAAVTGLLFANLATATATSDPLWTRQYGPVMIGAPAAWQKSTGKGVKVAVVDSGVDVDHPDLKPNLDLEDSYDFACNDPNPDDDSVLKDGEGKSIKGHGTHVSGTIAAVANNGIGVAGVAPDVKLMVMKGFPTDDNCGSLLTAVSSFSQSINRAVQRGAKVINLSVSDFTTGNDIVSTLRDSCENAFRQGSLCVIAAGNSGQSKSSGYPYDFNGIIVTANDSNGDHATFGQKADTKWGVSAPGVDVLNTWPIDDPNHDGYNSIQGTSMAAPHVAGAAAVLFGMGMNNKEVAERLTKTAGPPKNALVEGAGIIHLDRAAGVESASTATTVKAGGQNTPVTRGGRAGAGGGSQAFAPTTTVPQGLQGVTGATDFEEGLTTDDSNSVEALRLKEASRNAANKPFNVAGPLVGISVAATVIALGLAIPRLRAKDSPPLT